MRTFTTPIAGKDVTVYAPETGTFDKSAFRDTFPSGAMYGLDVESTALTDLGQFDPAFQLRTVQFGTAHCAWVLTLEDPDQREAAIGLLSDETVTFASYTNMDVLAVRTRLGVDITRRNWDVHVLAVMAAPDDFKGGKSLKPVAAKFGMPELEQAEHALEARFKDLYLTHVDEQQKAGKKGLRKVFDTTGKTWAWNTISVNDPLYLTYAGLDAIVARRLAHILVKHTGATRELLDQEMWLAGLANRMQIKGAFIDDKMLHELHDESQTATDESDRVIGNITGGLKSSQKVKLIQWLGENGADWSNHPKTDKGAPTIAKDNLKLLLNYPLTPAARQVVDELIKVQAYSNSRTKTQGVINAMTPAGRVHSTLHTVGAVTGRMSSSGPNMQNFSADEPRMRGMFIPDPGHVLISCDFAQIEMRVAAALAKDSKMLAAIERGADLHTVTAELLGVDRKIAKVANFRILYGGGAYALHKGANISMEMAQETVAKFWDTYSELAAFNRKVKRQTVAVRTISHRRIPVSQYSDGGTKVYSNMNYIIQSSARDLIVGATRQFVEHVEREGIPAEIWGLIHDEIVIQAPAAIADEVTQLAERCLQRMFHGLLIEADAHVLMGKDGKSRWGK